MINDKTADEILEELGYVRLDLDNIISYIYIKDPNSGNNISIISYPYSKFSDDYLDYIVKMQGRSSKYNIGDTIYLYYKLGTMFGKKIGFILGLMFLGYIFIPILACDKSDYLGIKKI